LIYIEEYTVFDIFELEIGKYMNVLLENRDV